MGLNGSRAIVNIIYQHKKLIANGQNFLKYDLWVIKNPIPAQNKTNPAKVISLGIDLIYKNILSIWNNEENHTHVSSLCERNGVFIKNSPIRKKGKIIANEKIQLIKHFFKEIRSINI